MSTKEKKNKQNNALRVGKKGGFVVVFVFKPSLASQPL